MASGTFLLRTLVVILPSGKPYLVVEVEIEDPAGRIEFRIPGSYVSSLHAQLAEVLEKHPGLCGRVGAVRDETAWAGRVEPGKTQLN